MSNLSDLLPSGGGQNIVDFTASGTIASGKPVVLNANGTVSEVAGSSPTFGSANIFDTDTVYSIATLYDPVNDRVIAFYDDGTSNEGYYSVGVVSGTNITWGTLRSWYGARPNSISPVFDTANSRIVMVYRNNNGYPVAKVGYISNLGAGVITFGSETTVNDYNSRQPVACYDSDTGKVIVTYGDTNNSTYGTSRVGTVSGESISFGSAVVFNSSATYPNGAVYHTGIDRTIFTYNDTGSSQIKAIVASISGTTPSFSGNASFHSGNNTLYATNNYNQLAYDTTANRVVFTARDSNGQFAYAGEAATSGVTWGSKATIKATAGSYSSIAFNVSAGVTTVFYTDVGPNMYGLANDLTISGSTITPSGTNTSYSDFNLNRVYAIYDPDSTKSIVVFTDNDSNTDGQSKTYSPESTNLSATNFLGLADAAISDTATGKINVKGSINSKQSSLTIGSDYYVQNDGSLNTATSAVNYDIANGSYTQAFSVSSQDTFPSGVAFNPAGTKMFVVGNTGDDVNEYTLSTGFDVSTASFVDSFSVSGQQAAPMSVAFNTDGTKMYIVGETEDTVAQYALSAGFDVSSASYTQAFDISGQETEAQGITFNTDGTKMFIVGDTGNDINEYTLSTGFDVSTASFVDSFSLASQTTQPKEGVFNTDGTELYVLARDNQKVYKYTLTTGFDVSSASYASVEFSVSSQETSPQGLAFSADGSKMYVCGDTGDDVNQYATTSTATNSTTTKVGQAVTATTINMMDLT